MSPVQLISYIYIDIHVLNIGPDPLSGSDRGHVEQRKDGLFH
jgi:hypothetical protein